MANAKRQYKVCLKPINGGQPVEFSVRGHSLIVETDTNEKPIYVSIQDQDQDNEVCLVPFDNLIYIAEAI